MLITGLSVNLFVPDSEKAFTFYQQVYQAKLESSHFNRPLGYKEALFSLGSLCFALADENPDWGSQSALSLGATPFCLQLFVKDLESVLKTFIHFGGIFVAPSTLEKPFVDHPAGFKFVNVQDPFGYIWSLTEPN